MRLATLVFAVLGLTLLGASTAEAQSQPLLGRRINAHVRRDLGRSSRHIYWQKHDGQSRI